MADHPEHKLQTAVGKFVRTAVTAPHRFACFDRSANDLAGRRHMWEAARHIKKGEPDTELLVPGIAAIRIELKSPGNRPTDHQNAELEAVRRAGHLAGWCDSVEAYGCLLASFGVPLAPNWRIQAQHHDAMLEAARLKVPAPKKKSRARQEKPSPSAIRRMERVRAKTFF